MRLAATAWQDDPQRGVAAHALLAKLDAEDAEAGQLARDADNDAAALVAAYPLDVQALLGQVEADLRAYNLTQDTAWRTLALQRAAQATFPLGALPDDVRRETPVPGTRRPSVRPRASLRPIKRRSTACP